MREYSLIKLSNNSQIKFFEKKTVLKLFSSYFQHPFLISRLLNRGLKISFIVLDIHFLEFLTINHRIADKKVIHDPYLNNRYWMSFISSETWIKGDPGWLKIISTALSRTKQPFTHRSWNVTICRYICPSTVWF